jgi:hypothetical protein
LLQMLWDNQLGNAITARAERKGDSAVYEYTGPPLSEMRTDTFCDLERRFSNFGIQFHPNGWLTSGHSRINEGILVAGSALEHLHL